jgi:hypothetical protein
LSTTRPTAFVTGVSFELSVGLNCTESVTLPAVGTVPEDGD